MRSLIFFFLAMMPAFITAQVPSAILMSDDSTTNKFGLMLLEGYGAWNSNVIDNEFMKKMVVGGHISSDHISDISGNLRDVNHAGFGLRGGLSFYSFRDSVFGSPSLGVKIAIANEYDAQLSFSRDLFDVVFKGNQDFQGKTADLGPLYGQYQVFQKFGIGLFDKRNYSGITLSLVNGQEFGALQVEESKLYTSEDGDSLNLSYKGEMWRSDTSVSGFGVAEGYGLCVDLNINLPLADRRGFISLQFNNMGFVSWNPAFENFEFDSSLVWTGVEVHDIFELSTDTLEFENLVDTLEYRVVRGRKQTSLPSRVGVRLLRKTAGRDWYEVGLNIQPNRSSVPMLYGGYTFVPDPRHNITLRLLYGGYGLFRAGLEYQVLVKKSWYLRAGTDDLPGVFSERAKGMSAFASIAKVFGGQ